MEHMSYSMNEGMDPVLKMEREREDAFYNLDRYVDRLSNRGRKETTITSYYQVIRSLINFLANKHLHCSPRLVAEREIMAIVNGYPVADLSKKSYLQVFSRWMMVMADNDVVRRMDLLWPSSDRPRRKWANYNEALRMFKIEDDPTNRIILVLAMDEGMRATEIAHMMVEDINENWIRVRGKGHRNGKFRSIPISDRVIETIGQYMEYRNYLLIDKEDCGSLILGRNGMPLTAHAVTQRVIRMAKKNGNDITAHSLRRRFITDTLNSGVKIEVCSKLVGHESPMVTASYYDCDPELLSNAMAKRREYLMRGGTQNENRTKKRK